ncbi:MAG: hypothetical protein JXA33_23635 [Anaerolineae bacterium]|nr:hypothetical protein [Anaerolineae bacterium]
MKKQYSKFLTNLAEMLIVPTLIYLMIWCILTYPLIFHFHTHFFADAGDGLQNVWNIWWINKAVTELHQSPWYTTYLHYPQGTSLLGQTLNPFNGFLGILLLKFLTLTETHNVIVLFSFVVGGVMAFWLAYSITKSYWSSLVAGYVFTFSQYHFMHAEGHLQLVSLEWIPLFVLCWYRLVTKPSVLKAIVAAIVLFGVLLCDHYYFLYCVLTGILVMVWYAFSSKDFLFFLKKTYLLTFAIFIFVSLVTSGILVGSLLRISIQDPLFGSHDPLQFSLDVLAPFIPGAHWRFAQLTKFYWSRLPGNINESSVYIGLSVVLLGCYGWYKRREIRLRYASFFLWYGVLLFFGIMALGPALQVGGASLFEGIMPYNVLQTLFPPLKLSGCPVRMMVMVMLSASVISAMGLPLLFQQLHSKKILIGGLLGIMLFFDFLPKPLPATRIIAPEYIHLLKNLPDDGGIMDTITPPSIALYYQTIYEKPMADGYISRYPTSVFTEYGKKLQAIQTRDYFTLMEEYDIHYLLASSKIANHSCNAVLLEPLYEDSNVNLFQIQKNKLSTEEIKPDMFYPSGDYLGSIDVYDGIKLSGWALIPNKDTLSSQIFILLSDGKQIWKVVPCRNKRPDVSDYYNKGNLYDESGYTVNLEAYIIPTGTYKIGIAVENGKTRVVKWTDHIFIASY